jgi:Transposase DDE domain
MMIEHETLLVTLVKLVGRIPLAPFSTRRGRGRPPTYPDHLFLQALVIMIVRHVHTVHTLLSVLAQPTPEMQTLRALLTVDGRFPARRTWERRLQAIPATLPAQIGCLGRALVSLIQPWASCGRAAAIDSTVLRARGGVWHKKDRDAGVVPHTSIDIEAHWTKSGWHGWIYGWKLHLVTTVAAVWIPLAADLTPANTADNAQALTLLPELPAEVRYILGDQHYNDPTIDAACAAAGWTVVATRRGPYPHTDAGVSVRRILHELRSRAIENLNEQFKGIFDAHGQVPTKGLLNTRRFALGAVFVYQLTLWYRHEHGLDLRVGLKPFLKAA